MNIKISKRGFCMTDKAKPPLIVIAGPTASGKSEVGVELAQILKTEIISADSVQVYRHFDIGSAKPSRELQAKIPHHLIDVVDPDDMFTLIRFREEALKVAEKLWAKNKIPLIVGGGGLYIKGLLEGLSGGVKTSPEALEKVAEIIRADGQEGLYKRAVKIDPVWTKKIHPNDRFRTERVVGVYLTCGKKMSDIFANKPDGNLFNALTLVLSLDRAILYRRIDERVDRMLQQGWREEVGGLVNMGYNDESKPMRSLGYRTILKEFTEKLDPDKSSAIIKKETRSFAKRQTTWFRGISGALEVKVSDGQTPQEVVSTILRQQEVQKFLEEQGFNTG